MLVFEDAKLFCAKSKFYPSALLRYLLPYLTMGMENDTQKLPIVVKAVILNSRDVYNQEMLSCK